MKARRNCTYNVGLGLVELLQSVTKLERQEIWSMLVDQTQICFDRIEKRNSEDSWRWLEFPGTSVRMKVKVYRPKTWNGNGYDCQGKATATITVDADRTETFTSQQVEEFLVEKVLLGAED